MIKIFETIKKYIFPLILLLVYVSFTVLTFGKWGNIFYDCFREVFIPQAILDGKILYSDITCLYPPLAYQVNALLFKIFGCSLNVLYSAAITCSVLILSLLYQIIERYSSSLTAFVVVLSVMEIFTFRIEFLNSASWFFPYSFSFLYAFAACFISFYFYVLYKEQKNRKLLYLIAFFAGLSIAFKLDFICFAFLIIYELFKNKELKDFLICLGVYFAPLVFTYGIWFIGGGSFDALVQYKEFILNFITAPSVLTFNKFVLFQKINLPVLERLTDSAMHFVLNMVIISGISFLLVQCNKKIKNLFFKILGLIPIFLYVYMYFFKNFYLIQCYTRMNLNLAIIPYIVMFGALFILFFKRNKNNYSKQEKIYILFAITGLLLSYRTFAMILISYIGNFSMILYWAAFLYLLLELLPEYFSALKSNQYKNFVAITILLYSFTYPMIYLILANQKDFPIRTEKEVVYTVKKYADPLNETINYIKTNTPMDSSVLVVDEGLVIN